MILVQDCLGYCQSVGRDFSFQGLVDLVDADVATSDDITADLSKAPGSQPGANSVPDRVGSHMLA